MIIDHTYIFQTVKKTYTPANNDCRVQDSHVEDSHVEETVFRHLITDYSGRHGHESSVFHHKQI